MAKKMQQVIIMCHHKDINLIIEFGNKTSHITLFRDKCVDGLYH